MSDLRCEKCGEYPDTQFHYYACDEIAADKAQREEAVSREQQQ
jgi:hypothetical protein